MTWPEIENTILSRLPDAAAESIRRTIPMYAGKLEEIRMRAERPPALTIDGRNILLPIRCSMEDLRECVMRLCGGSLYSHAETIRDGYICMAGGIRAGIGGRAVVENGKIVLLRDIHSVSIRIPHRIPAAGEGLFAALAQNGFTESVLVYAPPGCGKTTVLRELALRLSSAPAWKRTVVVDTRYELCADLSEADMLDPLYGYPRSTGMEIALRTLAPEYIICDEIASAEDSRALMNCAGSGVNLCASVHADSLDAICSHPLLQSVLPVFDWYYGIGPDHKGVLTKAGKDNRNAG